MTVFDVRCDRCGAGLTGPEDAVRFVYHPGDILLKDDSGLLCRSCWTGATRWLGVFEPKNRCSRCGIAVLHSRSVHVLRSGETAGWQLCPDHAVAFLNQLRTVDPKLSIETLSLADNWGQTHS